MAVDTPATIAVIGAGPVGLEAALYARFLGYDVRVYERSDVAGRLRQSPPSTPVTWRAAASPLGIAALAAQQPGWRPPKPDTILSAAELVEIYYLPLAQSDLLADSVWAGTEVVAIERDSAPGEDAAEADEVPGFRLRVRDAAGERIEKVDVILDASGPTPPADAQRLLFGALLGGESAGRRQAPRDESDPHRLLTAEADYYVLGAKGAACPSEFLLIQGLAQIRDLFTIIADRATLDLYASIGHAG